MRNAEQKSVRRLWRAGAREFEVTLITVKRRLDFFAVADRSPAGESDRRFLLHRLTPEQQRQQRQQRSDTTRRQVKN
jgi:hypothetical protein